MRKIKFSFKLLSFVLCFAVAMHGALCFAQVQLGTELVWSRKMGEDYKNAPSAVAADSDFLYTFVNKNLVKLNRFTGEIVASSKTETSSTAGYGIVPPTVSETMVFMPIRGGSVGAFDKETLELLWETPKKGGQTNCEVLYSEGKIYFGTWVSETKYGYFCCYSVDKNGFSQCWEISHKGGYYRTKALLDNGNAVFGSDDGEDEKNQSQSACLSVVDAQTGEVVSKTDQIEGDIRSEIVKYKDSYVFSTKAGYVYKVTGEDVSRVSVGGACSVTPVIDKTTAYVGTSGKAIVCVDLETMTVLKVIKTAANPNGGLTLRNGRVYTTCNGLPGGLYVIEGDGMKEIFTPPEEMQQYCVSPVVITKDAMIYYKNDSGNIFALRPYLICSFQSEKEEEAWLVRDKTVKNFEVKKGENILKTDVFPTFLWRKNLQPIVGKLDI